MTGNLTARRLRELLLYDPRTGHFAWRECPTHPEKIGQQAGWREPKGYWRVCIEGRNYQAHRLAWLWMTGKWPAAQVDHRDLDKANNRWSNLRLATNGQNQANTPKRRRNTSGIKGVYWHKRRGKWQAAIMVSGRLKSLGYRNTKEEAAALYAAAANQHFGEFARTA